jgi:hypothetical protein
MKDGTENSRKEEQSFLPDTMQRDIIKSFARTMERAPIYLKRDVSDFLRKVLKTDLFREYTERYTIYSQSPNAIAQMFLDELTELDIEVAYVKDQSPLALEADGMVGFWMGYVILQWVYREHISPEELQQYDYDAIYWAYDTLHTQDINYAIDFIKENYKASAIR